MSISSWKLWTTIFIEVLILFVSVKAGFVYNRYGLVFILVNLIVAPIFIYNMKWTGTNQPTSPSEEIQPTSPSEKIQPTSPSEEIQPAPRHVPQNVPEYKYLSCKKLRNWSIGINCFFFLSLFFVWFVDKGKTVNI